MAVDQTYYMRPGESTAEYNARIAAYNSSKNSSSSKVTTGNKSISDQLAELQSQLQKLQTQQQQGGGAQQQMNPGSQLTPSMGNAYFPNDFALVKIVGQDGYDSNIVWLADVASKTLRPFSDTRALETVYGMPLDQLQSHINYVGADSFTRGGVLGGFQPLSAEYAIKKDGSGRALDYSSVSLSSRYGQGINESGELKSYQALDGFLSLLKSQDGKVSDSQVNNVLNDPNAMAFYISALAYGGYTLSDVYSDMRRKQLGVTNSTPISATATRRDHQSSPEYKAAANDPQLKAPKEIEGLGSSVLNLPIFSIPDDAFKKLTPLLDPESDAFKDAMDDAANVVYESQLQMLQANTEQDMAAAQAIWQRNKTLLERKLGIRLSNDAIEAWSQIESYQKSASDSGIYGSGIMNQTIDDYLRDQRRRALVNRETTMTDKEQQDIEYYLKYASPEQIASLSPEMRQQWGMNAGGELQDYFSIENLKKMFPDETDEALQRVRDQYIDPNGNLYSSLYSSYAQNKYATQGNYNNWKSKYVRGNALLDEEDAYSQFTQPDSPFLRGSIDEDLVKKTTKNNGKSGNTINFKSQTSSLGNLVNRNSTPVTPTTAATSASPRAATPAPVVTAPRSVTPPTITPPKIGTYTPPGVNPGLNANTIKLPTTGQTASPYKTNTSSPYLTGQTPGGNILSSAASWISGLFKPKK